MGDRWHRCHSKPCGWCSAPPPHHSDFVDCFSSFPIFLPLTLCPFFSFFPLLKKFFIQFLKVTFLLQLLQNIGYDHRVVQYILVTYLMTLSSPRIYIPSVIDWHLTLWTKKAYFPSLTGWTKVPPWMWLWEIVGDSRNGPASVFLGCWGLCSTPAPLKGDEFNQQLNLGCRLGRTHERGGIAGSGINRRTWKVGSALGRSDKGLEMEPAPSAWASHGCRARQQEQMGPVCFSSETCSKAPLSQQQLPQTCQAYSES